MKVVNIIALVLVIVGALNWGLIGAFNFNLVTYIFGVNTILTRIVYGLVGICGLWSLTFFGKMCMND